MCGQVRVLTRMTNAGWEKLADQLDEDEFVRRGFMARMRVEPFGTGKVFPHEQTHSAAKVDRLKLTRAGKTNLSQIFGIYSDPENAAQNALENAIVGVAPLEAEDHLGVVHRLWPVTDVGVISEVCGLMSPKPLYIADGHHRYETALNYRQECSEEEGFNDSHGANFVLTMCVSMDDPGMIVLPTHRLFSGLPEFSSDELIEALQNHFEVEVCGTGPEKAEAIWERIELADDQGQIGLYCVKDETWVLVRVTEEGEALLAKTKSDQSSEWRGLGVSILHHLIMEELLQISEHPKPTYVHLVDELVDELKGSDNHQLAALVMPATLEHIRAISEHAERMPAKSTYFYPKLLSGLVLNPLS